MNWKCPHCGQEVYGIANELDLKLAKDLHRQCQYTHQQPTED